MALAAGRPVAVTPLPIFDELAGCVFLLPGITSRAMADGIQNILEILSKESKEKARISKNAKLWVAAHSFDKAAIAIFHQFSCIPKIPKTYDIRPDYDLSSENSCLRFVGDDLELRTLVGTRSNGRLISTSQTGYLTHGPYISIDEGDYTATMTASIFAAGSASIDICLDAGSTVIVDKKINFSEFGEVEISLEFSIVAGGASNLEFRTFVDSNLGIEILSVQLKVGCKEEFLVR
jgi:hypothetical protein